MLPHLPGLDHGRMDPAPAHYTIRINGHLGATVLSAFPALAPHHHGAHTVLTGLLDRSALYGVLAEIEALGLDLLEIRKLTPDRESPVPRSPPLTVTATTVGSARSLLAEGEALMTSAPCATRSPTISSPRRTRHALHRQILLPARGCPGLASRRIAWTR